MCRSGISPMRWRRISLVCSVTARPLEFRARSFGSALIRRARWRKLQDEDGAGTQTSRLDQGPGTRFARVLSHPGNPRRVEAPYGVSGGLLPEHRRVLLTSNRHVHADG